jgi:phospholipid/cholesterol/gamma-HCH transport system substrate-binding protein
MRHCAVALAAGLAALCLTGCTPYTGINSLPLPGTVGTGGDSYQVSVQLKNANDLVANTPVFVNDINVGTVTRVALDGWTPTLTLSLKKDVRLPANAVASLGQTSLLGSKHIQLSEPTATPAQGRLQGGALIKEDRTHAYPETEDLLAGVSTLLNGGGLQHFETITTEFNRALGGGRANDTRELLGQLNVLTAGLDVQRGDIISALKGFDRLGSTLAPRMNEVDQALEQLPAGLHTLDEQEPALVDALQSLGDSAQSIAPFADGGSKELRGVLNEIEPVLRHTADIQKGSLPRALRQLPFLIFTLDTLPTVVRGDYANVDVTLDLTLDRIDKTFLTGTPLSGGLFSVAEAGRSTRSNGTGSGPPLGKSPSGPSLPSTVLAPGLQHPPAPSDSGPLPKKLPGIGGN